MSSFKSALFAGCALFGALSSTAFAADPAPAAPVQTGWILTLGLGPQVQTSFPGARSVTVWPTGAVGLRRPGEPVAFSSPDDGMSVTLLDLGWLRAGPAARVISQRGLSGGNGAFYGLPDVGTSVELGAFVELWYADMLRLRGEARQAVSGHDGFDANISIDGVYRTGPFTFALGPRLQFGNSTYMNAYFSVTPEQAALNGKVTPYTASGGLGSVGVGGSVKYDYDKDWSLTVFGAYNRLVSQAAASPVPNNLGSLNQFTAGAILSRAFYLESIPFLN
ncbi:MipA/OmpV family protein [Methylocella sp.]|uniref:MipA/OmpV family protein n=1 Tax=Methylocella sp. TaxID=1978226 RepID=UPI00378491C2